MKIAGRLNVSMVALGILAMCAPVCRSAETYRVSEIIRVLSPVSFECRLDGFKYAPQARCQVFLSDVLPVQERETQATAALYRMLRSARTLELRVVRIRNYFRVEGQVLADSKDVAEQLTSENYLQRPIPVLADIAQVRLPPVSGPEEQTETSASRLRMIYSLEQLKQTKVNLSSLRADTPFGEALQMIGSSVQPRLPMVVFWRDIEANAFVDRNTPIGVEGFGEISLAMGLDTVLYSVGSDGMPLRFTIEGGILKIGTQATLSKKSTQVYSVIDLLSPPSYDTTENGKNSGGY